MSGAFFSGISESSHEAGSSTQTPNSDVTGAMTAKDRAPYPEGEEEPKVNGRNLS